MRWFPFLILAYIMLGLQIGVGGLGRVGSVNFVLIAAVFLSLNGTRAFAVPACFALGLLQDLSGIGPIGTYALAYSIVALLVAGTDRALAADHPLTHFVVTLVCGIVVAIVLWLHGLIARYGVAVPIGGGMVAAFYTAVASLPVMWLLNRMRRRFRFRRA